MQISMKACYKLMLWLWLGFSSIPKVPRIGSLQFLCNISKKKVQIKLIFYIQVNIKSFLQVDFNTLVIKVSYKLTLSLLMDIDTILIQYLKKEVRNGVCFLHEDKHQSFYKLALSFLIEVARHIQSTQNRKLVIFLQYSQTCVRQPLLGPLLSGRLVKVVVW